MQQPKSAKLFMGSRPRTALHSLSMRVNDQPTIRTTILRQASAPLNGLHVWNLFWAFESLRIKDITVHNREENHTGVDVKHYLPIVS